MMRFYTYTHATPDGRVFYVGKGTGHRAFSSGKRPLAWRQMVSNHDGITIKIVQRFETEDEAFAHEKALIELYRSQGFELINATDGGRGPLGYHQSPEVRAHKSRLMTGYKYTTITCPHCGTQGGETSMKRWHFDKCTGAKRVKARATVNGKRVFLGNYATKEEAAMVVQQYLSERVV